MPLAHSHHHPYTLRYEPVIGDAVQVHGLTSDAGSRLNGVIGFVKSLEEGGDRCGVKLLPEGLLRSIKLQNLRCPTLTRYHQLFDVKTGSCEWCLRRLCCPI